MILPASKLEQREVRVPVEAQPGVTQVSITLAGDPSPVCREALAEVARLGLRHMRLGLGLGGGLS